MNQQLGYSSVQKTIEILTSFIPDNKEIGTLELSDKLGLHKSTVSRLLQILKHYHFISQDPDTKKYRLGETSGELGRAFSKFLSTYLIQIGRPYMYELRDIFGVNVAIEELRDHYVSLVREVPGTSPLSVSFETGARMPFHAAAGAKAILAFVPPEFANRILNSQLIRFSSNTITDPDILREELAEVRRQGVAFDRGEYNVGVYAVGAPIFNDQEVRASISISFPSNRMESYIKSGIIDKLKENAKKLSDQLHNYNMPKVDMYEEV